MSAIIPVHFLSIPTLYIQISVITSNFESNVFPSHPNIHTVILPLSYVFLNFSITILKCNYLCNILSNHTLCSCFSVLILSLTHTHSLSPSLSLSLSLSLYIYIYFSLGRCVYAYLVIYYQPLKNIASYFLIPVFILFYKRLKIIKHYNIIGFLMLLSIAF